MKIIIAPNAFKGSLSPLQVANAMKQGVRQALPQAQIILLPLSDGGDGFLEVMGQETSFQMREYLTQGPCFEMLSVPVLVEASGKRVIIESAKAIGLTLLSESQRNPLWTSSWGLGELILKVMEDLSPSEIIIGLGGSATCDGGIGIASALGVRFLNANGDNLPPVGNNLIHLEKIDLSGLHPKIKQLERLTACCDVSNPLLGTQGSAPVYAPQKGANAEAVQLLEKGLTRLANRILADVGKDVQNLPWGGSAGGLGAGIYSFLGGQLESGIEFVMNWSHFKDHLQNANLVLTGEGSLDAQTLFGKVPVAVAKKAVHEKVPCFALAGQIRGDSTLFHSSGIQAIFSICPYPMSSKESIEQADLLLIKSTEQAVRAFLSGFQASR